MSWLELFRHKHPQRYQVIVEMLARKVSYRRIAKMVHADERTVRAIADALEAQGKVTA